MADDHATDDRQQARGALIRAALAGPATHRPLTGGTAGQRFQYEQRCADVDRSLRQAVDALRVAGEPTSAIHPEPVSGRHP